MDVETTPPLENGTKENNDKVQNDPSTADPSKPDNPKSPLRPRSKKSRSRTPSQDVDDQKILRISLKPMKEIKENGETIEENELGTENGDKNEEEPAVRRSKRIKEDATKGEDNKNENSEKSEDEPAQRRSKRNKDESKVDDVENEKNAEDVEEKELQRTSLEKKVESSPKKDNSPKKDEGSPKKSKKSDAKNTSHETEIVEMEPLVISDEAEPELQFDESSDFESDKGSPIIPRCHTRRSQTRNIPTPKTPKSLDNDFDASEKNSVTGETDNGLPKSDNLEETGDSMNLSNISTRAEVGSDVTRLQYLERNNLLTDDSVISHDDNYLKEVRERSLSDTLRCLSARKPIRDDYRRRALRTAQERSDLNLQSNISFESITTGVKRKQRSMSPEEKKKFKAESPGFFTSPLAGLRSRFKTDVPTSTPKLTGYKDINNDLHFDENHEELENGIADKKNWCTVM